MILIAHQLGHKANAISGIVPGPYSCEAAEVFHAGAVAGEVYQAGQDKAESFQAGSADSEAF